MGSTIVTVAIVEEVVKNFLHRSDQEVMVIKGAWGTGKTYTWKKLFEENQGGRALTDYCYISLFGISSMTELRAEIFTRIMIYKGKSKKLPGGVFEKLSNIVRGSKKPLSKMFNDSLKDYPILRNVPGVLGALLPHFTQNAIICFDDFERMNTECIKPDEFMGLISELKEEKDCKIVLIFNDSKLSEASSNTYLRYREKVVDIELLFAPTAEEIADIVLSNDVPQRELIKECTVFLKIRNFRILKTIVRLLQIAGDAVASDALHPDVMKQVVQTTVLAARSYYSSDDNEIPPIDFIKKQGTLRYKDDDPNKDDDSNRAWFWDKELADYGFNGADELDHAIIRMIECGYHEGTGLTEQAQKMNERLLHADFRGTYHALVHETFENNEEEIVQTIPNRFKESVRYCTVLDLNGVTTLLRALDRNDLADELIQYYIEARREEPKLFDLQNYPFPENITDNNIRGRFNEHFAATQVPCTLADVVKQIANERVHSPEQAAVLRKATDEDFYQIFKEKHGNHLGRIIRTCLQFEHIEGEESVGKMARTALTRIRKESRLNAFRMKMYGTRITGSATE